MGALCYQNTFERVIAGISIELASLHLMSRVKYNFESN